MSTRYLFFPGRENCWDLAVVLERLQAEYLMVLACYTSIRCKGGPTNDQAGNGYMGKGA